jgi:hypothetical protein
MSSRRLSRTVDGSPDPEEQTCQQCRPGYVGGVVRETATVTLRTSVTGFEGTSLDGMLETTDTNGKPITVGAAVMVSTSRTPTM